MNLSNKAFFILSFTFLAGSPAYANNEITITGYVIDSTCSLTSDTPGTTNGGNGDIAVILDTVPTTNFTGLNSTTGEKTFKLNLTKSDGSPCDEVTSNALKSITLIPTGDYDVNNPSILINTLRTNAANRVNLQVLTDNGTLVTFNAPEQQAKSPVVVDANQKATLTYAARYILSDNTATTQNVQAAVTYTLQYN